LAGDRHKRKRGEKLKTSAIDSIVPNKKEEDPQHSLSPSTPYIISASEAQSTKCRCTLAGLVDILAKSHRIANLAKSHN
jgi:hypothetical protein